MKRKIGLFLVLIVAVVAASLWAFERSDPNRILRRMSDYYGSLNSFEGANTIVVESTAGKTTNQKQFAFQRPNRFMILPDTTNDSQLYCDGTNLYDYRPYYFNSYTKVPAPARFEDVITNRLGGELLLMIARTNRLDYLVNGFGRGLKALKYDGRENINGIDCDHLDFQLASSKVMELWVARGAEPYAVKYEFAFRSALPNQGEMHYTETISDWNGDSALPANEFVFAPPNGAVERPVEDDQVELSQVASNGPVVATFYSSEKVANEARMQADFLKANQRRFQDIALKAILGKYPNLAAGDLVFKDVEQSSDDDSGKGFVVTFDLPKTIKIMSNGKSAETLEDTVTATLSADGRVEHIERGSSVDFSSK